MASCRVIKVGDLVREEMWLLGAWLGIRLQAVSNCIVHHFIFLLVLVFFLFSFSHIYLFQFSSSPHCGGSEQTAVWCFTACWVKPLHIQLLHSVKSNLYLHCDLSALLYHSAKSKSHVTSTIQIRKFCIMTETLHVWNISKNLVSMY